MYRSKSGSREGKDELGIRGVEPLTQILFKKMDSQRKMVDSQRKRDIYLLSNI